ncbi:putative Rho-type GTPase-activating protein 2 [Colletotrichum spinosum]|uniref:Putative Rho-type GTPase-activating protein 2 n=1 Tax=Colletotrichum spinosum TaxID=1347390 RepID=A0A4R8PUB7_9PEZI|nr:putative Rho-type GTPase-activating protein 2 [Colletotrichum spinosum]
MGRKHVPQPLTLSESQSPLPSQPAAAHQLEPGLNDPPRSAETLADEHRNFDGGGGDDFQHYPPISSALHRASVDTPPRQHHQHHPISPRSPYRLDQPSPAGSTTSTKASSKGGFFFNFSKATKSSHSLVSSPAPSHHHQQRQNPDSRGETMSRGPDGASSMGTQPTHPTGPTAWSIPRFAYHSSYAEQPVQKPAPAPTLPTKSDVSLPSAADYDPPAAQSSSKKGKSKPFGLLSRTKSLRDKDRDKDGPSSSREKQTSPVPITISEPEPSHIPFDPNNPRKTSAPVADRSLREMVNSSSRNRSEDRASPRDMGNKESHKEKGNKENVKEREHHPRQNSSSQNGGFFGGLKSGRDMISNRLFGKGGRSGSTTEREPVIDDEHYVLKTINLPLREQTRRTRISKRLEDSRDKTEFWMPAFPWRAIDYLNYKGCDVEGLYRVPGSGPQIKKWQRRFDEEYDVNLFEQPDLYDINIIGSMLKAWLRELPDELFPKEAQERVARECAGFDTVPPLLVEELSNLSPFNYYLLFAITCHLSLLLAHSDKNKMDFRNLCICFQPCMKIDAFCFRFLVCDWRDCWKGCKNEAKYIEEEYQLFDQPPPKGLSEPRKPSREISQETTTVEEAASAMEQRAGSPSGSSKQSTASANANIEATKDRRIKKKPLQLSESNGSVGSTSTTATTLTIDSGRDVPRGSNDLRPLSPIKPLSPLGF